MVLNDGTHAAVSRVGGYISYKIIVESCVDYYKCPIEVYALETITRRVHGSITDVAGSTSDYVVEQVGLRVNARFSGTWNALTQAVTFPDLLAPVAAEVWGGKGTVDGSRMWVGSQAVEIRQIVGSFPYPYDADNPLTLNFAFNTSEGAFFASLTTIPE